MMHSPVEANQPGTMPAFGSRFDLRRLPIAATVAVASLLLQWLWLGYSLGWKIAFLHLIPGSFTVCAVTAAAALMFGRTSLQYVVVGCYTLLALRLPITLSPVLVWVAWPAFFVLVVLVLWFVWRVLRADGSGRYYLLACGIVLFNALGHLSLESPFTHTFHLFLGMPSDFQGEDNERTWECAYDGGDFAVQCDARHFIASELVFVDPEYDPSFSVVLTRFYSGYLNSLLGSDGTRWYASLAIHLFFWCLACAVVYRLCRLFQFSLPLARVATLCTASAWGLVSLVAQPMPYFLSYVFALFSVWAVLEWILTAPVSRLKQGFLLLVPALTIAVYEAYPIALAGILLLCFYRRFAAAFAVATLQVAMVVLWKHVGLATLLGTLGDVASPSSGVSNLSRDVNAWLGAIGTLDLPQLGLYFLVGTIAYLFGNLIVGALAGVGMLVRGRRLILAEPPRQSWWLTLFLVNGLVLAATIFIVPQTFVWAPATGMQPRLAFFSFLFNLTALVYWVESRHQKWLWFLPVAFLILANIDKFGFASHAMLFDYGAPGWYWY